MTEFITFELEGKRHGWYKSYKRLNETDMEIIILSIEGETLRSGFLRKIKTSIPKGKAVTMREMNLSQSEDLVGTMLGEVTVTAPRLPQGGGYVWGYSWGSGSNNQDYYNTNKGDGSGGGGESNTNFYDSNYTQIEDKLKNPCFKNVLDELKNYNVYGKICDIIQKFNSTTQGNKYSAIINENTEVADPRLKGRNAFVIGNVITLNSSTLRNASKEYIARVVIHEILHVHINSRFSRTDHQIMLNDYVNEIATFLNNLYNTDVKDAKVLSLLGLQNEHGCYGAILKDLGIKEMDVYDTDQKYKYQNYVKRCN